MTRIGEPEPTIYFGTLAVPGLVDGLCGEGEIPHFTHLELFSGSAAKTLR